MTSRPRSVTTRRLLVACAATAVGLAPVLATSPAANAAGPVAKPLATSVRPLPATAADTRIASQLTARATTARVGAAFTGAVIDVASRKVVWSKNGNTGRMPASTTKWVTATDALRVFGPTYRFTTTVRSGAPDQVVLVGSGDPSLTSAQVTALARTTADAMKTRGLFKVRVYADDRLFAAPSLATGWKSTYIPADTTWLRALVVDGRQVPDTTIDAAKIFAAKLKTYGLTVSSVARGSAGASSPVLASSPGQTVSQIVSTMMLESDNEYAEALHRLVGIKLGYGNTWAAARNAQAARLRSERLNATALYDGSGLSRSDRLTGIQLARLVSNAFEPTNTTSLAILRSDTGLPISGQTGTLRASYSRFTASTSKCAVGKVHAKTGTLTDAVALTGWTKGTDGRVKAFAFVINGKPTSMTLMRQNIDMFAATVTGCY